MERGPVIKWFKELQSTNDELLGHIGDYDNLSVVAALSQTSGRGQRGNRWLSSPGENLTFSILYKPRSLPAAEFMSITHLATLAVRDWMLSQGAPAKIKWPNDIYCGHRKMCGMLIENTLSGGMIGASVIGIGINLNQTVFPGELVNPGSLKRLTGRDFDLDQSLREILSLMDFGLPESETGRERLRDRYNEDLFRKGVPAPYRDLRSGEEFTGTIRGAAPDGRLIVETGGKVRLFSFKEVGYII